MKQLMSHGVLVGHIGIDFGTLPKQCDRSSMAPIWPWRWRHFSK